MNNNGVAVLAGLLLVSIGVLNQVNNDARIIVSIILVIVGFGAMFIGVMMDRID